MDIKYGMNQKVQWYAQTGEIDERGQPLYKRMGTVSARINRKAQLLRLKDGREVTSGTMVHMVDKVRIGDKLAFDGQEQTVVDVGDGLGVHAPKPSFYIAYL